MITANGVLISWDTFETKSDLKVSTSANSEEILLMDSAIFLKFELIDETFIFSPFGELLGHWVGDNCYDENGNVVMTRQIMK